MHLFLYLEINVIAFVLLIILLSNQHRAAGLSAEQRVFNLLLYVMMAMLVLDSGMWTLDGRTFAYARELNYAVSSLYYMANTFVPFVWFWYVSVYFNRDITLFGRYRFLTLSPLLLNTVLVVLNLQNQSIFFIDSKNNYIRGDYFIVSALLAASYLLLSAVIALQKLKTVSASNDKRRCKSIMLFMVLPVIGSIIQSLSFGVSLIWICAVLSCLMIFVNVQNQQISTDALTGLNNRYQFNRYLLRTVEHEASDYALIMIDVDKFKSINDTYGHVEGDHALVAVAELLKKSCERMGAFLSRYGGDEFAIICPTSRLQELLDAMKEHLQQHNAVSTAPFTLSLSVGHASLEGVTSQEIDLLIAKADSNMYSDKLSK